MGAVAAFAASAVCLGIGQKAARENYATDFGNIVGYAVEGVGFFVGAIAFCYMTFVASNWARIFISDGIATIRWWRMSEEERRRAIHEGRADWFSGFRKHIR